MGRKSQKQIVIEMYPFLENYIKERWEYYLSENEDFVGIQTQENIADNIIIDIEEQGLDDEEIAKKEGLN